MSTTVGTVTIEMAAGVARLQADMDRAKKITSDTVGQMKAILSTIGVGISIEGFKSMVMGVVETGKKLNELHEITGITIEQLGALSKLAKIGGTDIERVATGIGIMAKNMYAGSSAFDTLGVATKKANGDLRSSGDVFNDVADRFSKMENGATKSAMANAIFGKSGRDLIPILNQGKDKILESTDAYGRLSGMSLELARQSQEFDANLLAIKARTTAVKTSLTGELLPSLNAIAAAFLSTSSNANKFNLIADVLGATLKALVVVGFSIVDVFQTAGRAIGAAAASAVALARLDFIGVKTIAKAYEEDGIKSRAEFDKFVNTVMEGSKKINATEESESSLRVKLKDEIDAEAAAMKRLSAEAAAHAKQAENELKKYNELSASIRLKIELNNLETQTAGKLTESDKLRTDIDSKLVDKTLILTSAQRNSINVSLEELAVSEKLLQNKNFVRQQSDALTSSSNSSVLAMRSQVEAMRDQNALIGLNAEQIAELVGKKNLDTAATIRAAAAYAGDMHDAYIQYATDLETVAGLQKDLANEQQIQKAAQDQANMWMSVEQTAKSAFIQIAAHGKSAMKSVGEAIKLSILDLLYQLTIRKWIINIGTSIEGGSFSTTSLLSSGKTMLDGFSKGAGDLFSSLGNTFGLRSLGAFGTGLSSSASAGVFGPGGAEFLGGTGTAIGAGSEFGALSGAGASIGIAAGPLIGAFVATQMAKMLAGDKRVGGTFGKIINTIGDMPIVGDLIPVIPLINALFGRGPMKFVDQQLTGKASSSGFEGTFTNDFKAKGGLLVGSKRKAVDEALTAEQQQLFDTTLAGFYGSAHNFAKNLGIDVGLVDNFSQQIRVSSASKEKITAQAITDMLTGVGDSIAKNALPVVDNFKKVGETSLMTLGRLSNEVTALTDASVILGLNLSDARAAIGVLSVESRTAIVDAAGGADELLKQADFFAKNFMSGGEVVQRKGELLREKLTNLGLSADMTKEQFRQLVESFGKVDGVSKETFGNLMSVQQEFVDFNNGLDSVGGALVKVNGILEITQNEFEAAVTILTNVGYSYADSIATIEGLSAEQLRTFFSSNGGATAILEVSQIVADGFLTASERIKPTSDRLAEELNAIHLPADFSLQSARDLLTLSGGYTKADEALRESFMHILKDYVAVNGTWNDFVKKSDELKQTATEAPAALSVLTDSIKATLASIVGNSTDLNALITRSAKPGESQDATAQRIIDDHNAIVAAGFSVTGMSIDMQVALIDAASGIQKFTGDLKFFNDNFYSSSEKLSLLKTSVSKSLSDLGLSKDTTKEQFRQLVESFGKVNGVSAETFAALMNLAPAFLQVRDAADAAVKQMAQNAFNDLKKSVDAERAMTTDKYNIALKASDQSIQDVTESVKALQSVADMVTQSISQLQPLSIEQAKKNLEDFSKIIASGGVLPNQDAIRESLGAVGKLDTHDFASAVDMAREQASIAGMVRKLGAATNARLDKENAMLDELKKQRFELQAGFDAETKRLDGILATAQAQLDSLNMINGSVLSLTAAMSQFASAVSAAMSQAAPVPTFASGGMHTGGLRLVGEHGPELEYTPASRIFNNSDTSDILDALAPSDKVSKRTIQVDNSAGLRAEIVLLKQDLTKILSSISVSADKSQRILDNVSAGGFAFMTTVAP